MQFVITTTEVKDDKGTVIWPKVEAKASKLESDAVFNQMHSSLGAFVENSTIENDIEVEARAGYPHEPAQRQLSFRPIAESPWGGATQAGTSPLWYNDRFWRKADLLLRYCVPTSRFSELVVE